MKRNFFLGRIGLLLLCCGLILASCGKTRPETPTEPSAPVTGPTSAGPSVEPKPAGPAPTRITVPSTAHYPNSQWASRSVWDLAVFEGRLYAGSGDYALDTGPTNIWSMDLESETWENAITASDQEITRFLPIGDKLFVPGGDSTLPGWDYGNYYFCKDGVWESFKQLPKAAHTFDIASYDGKLFFGIGTGTGPDAPVLVSADGQTDFQAVPFLKNGRNIHRVRPFRYTRVYDFFTLGDSLYCLLAYYLPSQGTQMEYYRYDNGAFHWVSALKKQSVVSWKHVPVMGKATYQDAVYLTTGGLYKTTDFTTFTKIPIPGTATVTDLYVYTGEDGQSQLYALTCLPAETGYTVKIYQIGQSLTEVASCTGTCQALSLVRTENAFYIGFGSVTESSADVGTVLKLPIT